MPVGSVAPPAGRYELVETIASGGMARVFLGRMRAGPDDAAPAPVAVKILHPHLAADPDAVALFLDEARVATRIRHPNVVEVRDVDMVGEDLVIIMEYIEGIALSSMIRALRDAGSSIPMPARCNPERSGPTRSRVGTVPARVAARRSERATPSMRRCDRPEAT